jgi:hypothetical protein
MTGNTTMMIANIGRNMTEVDKGSGVYVLISYSTPVAAFVPGEGVLFQREGKASSRTTAKHINKWAAAEFSDNVTKAETTAAAIQTILDA